MIGPGVVNLKVTARHTGGDCDDSDHGSGLLAVELEIWTIAGPGLVCHWDWHGGLVVESG